jgi:hypothetical protein
MLGNQAGRDACGADVAARWTQHPEQQAREEELGVQATEELGVQATEEESRGDVGAHTIGD